MAILQQLQCNVVVPKWVVIGIMSASMLPARASSSAAQAKPQPACLAYEPTVVTLRGTLVSKTFPGPPNFESIRNGDKPETYWLLDLPAAVCINEDKVEPDLNPAQEDVREIQLVLKSEWYKQHKALLGREIVATGTLFGRHTGHHHTSVLLTVHTLMEASK
jgi:hypothetical protein